MHEPTLNPNMPPASETTLTPAEQAALRQLLALPTEQLLLYLCVLHHFEQAPPKCRALALMLLNGRLPAKVVAWLSGVSDRQLRRYPEIRTATLLLREQGNRPPWGAKDREGAMEAWDADQ
jgi:hypothetical protein